MLQFTAQLTVDQYSQIMIALNEQHRRLIAAYGILSDGKMPQSLQTIEEQIKDNRDAHQSLASAFMRAEDLDEIRLEESE